MRIMIVATCKLGNSYLGLYRDSGRENANYCSILGLCTGNKFSFKEVSP